MKHTRICILTIILLFYFSNGLRDPSQSKSYNKYERKSFQSVRGFGIPYGFQNRFVLPMSKTGKNGGPNNEKFLNHISDKNKRKHVLNNDSSLIRNHKHKQAPGSNNDYEFLKKYISNNLLGFISVAFTSLICIFTFVYVKYGKIQKAFFSDEDKSDSKYTKSGSIAKSDLKRHLLKANQKKYKSDIDL